MHGPCHALPHASLPVPSHCLTNACIEPVTYIGPDSDTVRTTISCIPAGPGLPHITSATETDKTQSNPPCVITLLSGVLAGEWEEATGTWPGSAPDGPAQAPATLLSQPVEFQLVLVGPDAVVRSLADLHSRSLVSGCRVHPCQHAQSLHYATPMPRREHSDCESARTASCCLP